MRVWIDVPKSGPFNSKISYPLIGPWIYVPQGQEQNMHKEKFIEAAMTYGASDVFALQVGHSVWQKDNYGNCLLVAYLYDTSD